MNQECNTHFTNWMYAQCAKSTIVLKVTTENDIKINVMKKTTLILLFTVLNVSLVHSQGIDNYSISVKGTTNIFKSNEFFEGIEINAFSQHFLYSMGFYRSNDQTLFGDKPYEKYNQLNLLFGKYADTKNKKFRFQYQAGIGMFWGSLRTDEFDAENSSLLNNAYFTKEVSTVGFPLKIGGRYIPFEYLSIGIDLQANLNFQKSIITPMLSIEIGKLRSTKK